MTIPQTIKETQDGILNKKFSAVELTDAYLERINKLNKKLNIYLTISDALAYEQAKKVDKIINQLGSNSIIQYPLLGVAIAHKDIFLTKGVRTTAASKVLESYIPAYSATVVKKLENAGCITLGKVNCDAWAHGSSGENSDFGPTKNPWNDEYVPGGSSSGSGAAVASKLALVATGTDTCGSIRLPANYCGVVGLKPTYGVISRYGIVAMASSLDCVGPIANTVEDVQRLFEIMKGGDGKDSTVTNYKQILNRKFKIGIPREFFIKGLDKEIEENIKNSTNIFKNKGVDFLEVRLPTTKYAVSTYYIIQPAEVSSNLGRYDGIRYGNSRETFGAEAKRRIMLGTYVLSEGYYEAYYLRAMKVRTKIKQEVDEVFKKVDALIAPVVPTPPFRIGEKVDNPLKMYLTDIFAATANLSGIPSLAIPSGFTKNGLPLGFQIMGPRFSEEVLFKLGELFQNA